VRRHARVWFCDEKCATDDIGINFTDPQFRGRYRGKVLHPDDFATVVARAKSAGVRDYLVTGDCMKGSQEAIALCKEQGRASLDHDYRRQLTCEPRSWLCMHGR
jgi:Tat protein secretion system quality control protein TatD with DNase activity